jgi:NAD+-dependent protein deacetylase sirtuin 5
MHGRVWDVLCTNFECQYRERNYDVPVCPALVSSGNPSDGLTADHGSNDSETGVGGPATTAHNNEQYMPSETHSNTQQVSPLAALHASLHSPPTLRKTGLLPPPPPPRIPDSELPRCTKCGALARPGEVWFGEAAMHMEKISKKVEEADLCLVIGTSATVSYHCGKQNPWRWRTNMYYRYIQLLGSHLQFVVTVAKWLYSM